jgi:protein-tyrosine-phosphatase
MSAARVVFAALLAFAGLTRTSAAQQHAVAPVDTVLFVCEHGTVKSVLAKLYFEQFARERGLQVVALSRGTRADSVVPPWMVSHLAGDRLTLGAFQPRALAAADLANKRMVISFDLPASATAAATAPREQWDGLPSVSQDYAAGRDAIKRRVRALVDSLARAYVRPPA